MYLYYLLCTACSTIRLLIAVDPTFSLTNSISVRLTGTKLGCGEGGCGACTVMVSHYDPASDKVQHHAVNACLAPLCTVDSLAVTTVEGIGSTKTTLHPCQVRTPEFDMVALCCHWRMHNILFTYSLIILLNVIVNPLVTSQHIVL